MAADAAPDHPQGEGYLLKATHSVMFEIAQTRSPPEEIRVLTCGVR